MAEVSRRDVFRIAALGLASQVVMNQPATASDVLTVHPCSFDGIIAEQGVAAKMRDGNVLYADIYRPNGTQKLPVLMERTCYNKASGGGFGLANTLKAAQRGYVVIIQDVRGRYSSEGEWYPFKHESEDGFDSVEWASTLRYCDGRVAMSRGSYTGATQMLAAIAHPPHLAGVFDYITPSNYHNGWVYQGGAFEQWFNETWISNFLALDTLGRYI